jgi:hypothetical protein
LTAAAWTLAVAAPSVGFGSATEADQSTAASGTPSIEITGANAEALARVLEYEIRQGGGYSGQLATSDGRLYIQTRFPHSLLAFDPRFPQRPLWTTAIEGDSAAVGLDCCSATVGGPIEVERQIADRARIALPAFGLEEERKELIAARETLRARLDDVMPAMDQARSRSDPTGETNLHRDPRCRRGGAGAFARRPR